MIALHTHSDLEIFARVSKPSDQMDRYRGSSKEKK